MAKTGNDDAVPTDSERVLHVRFRRSDDERIEATLDALDHGETPESYFEVTFERVEDLHRVTSPRNYELLQTILRENPRSIRETASFVERDVRAVHRNLEELDDLGLIDLDDHGSGRPTQPTVWYDTIEVDLPLDLPDGSRLEA